jgi:hypothetical protein
MNSWTLSLKNTSFRRFEEKIKWKVTKNNPLSPPLLRSKGGFNALAPKANS